VGGGAGTSQREEAKVLANVELLLIRETKAIQVTSGDHGKTGYKEVP
jgi:hypothetical protein